MRPIYDKLNCLLDFRLTITEFGSILSNCFISKSIIISKISKKDILSNKTSSFNSKLFNNLLYQHPSLLLTILVLHELNQGEESKFSHYLKNCPNNLINIANLWPEDSLAKQWIKNTTLDRSINDSITNLVRSSLTNSKH
jgi:hypothetical protein